MSSKPENTFIKSLHRELDKLGVYHEKMNNPFRAGTADVWYSGVAGDLWIEYKYVPKLPKKTLITPDLSPRQLKWLADRFDENRNVWVVVGSPNGCKLYQDPKSWTTPCSTEDFIASSYSKADLARLIYGHTGASPCTKSRAVST